MVLALVIPTTALGQTAVQDLTGVIVGRVYEVNPDKYEEYRDWLERRWAAISAADGDLPEELFVPIVATGASGDIESSEDMPSRDGLDYYEDQSLETLDPDDYLDRMEDAVVTARQMSTSNPYSSEFSDAGGEYMIQRAPTGTYAFEILHEGVTYPVSQRLDLNVELSYIAELCFVVDREEQKAWMISEGMRRDPEAPPFVPERCRSGLSGCLGLLFNQPDGFPNGLLLLLAGSGAAATTIGIISTQQDEASNPNPPPN